MVFSTIFLKILVVITKFTATSLLLYNIYMVCETNGTSLSYSKSML